MYVVKCIWSNVSNPSCNNAFSNNLRESRKVFCVKTTQTLYLKVLCGRKLKMQKKYDSLSTVDLEKERMKESIKKASHSRLKSNNIVQYREVRPDCFRMPLRYFVHLYNIVYTVYYPLIHCSIVLILAQCATWGSSLLTTWLVSNAWDESLVRKMTSYSFGPFPDDFGNSKVFELYLIYYCCRGNRRIYFRCHGSADDLADNWHCSFFLD